MARADKDDESFRKDLSDEIKQFATGKSTTKSGKSWSKKSTICAATSTRRPTFDAVKKRLDEIEKNHNTGKSRLYYLATGAEYFTKITALLAEADMVKQEGDTWRRVIIEKPFGTDLASAQALNKELLSVMEENQIFRIDHYLGKETVQNIHGLPFCQRPI